MANDLATGDGLIDRYCAAHGLTLKQFGERVGLSRLVVYRIRSGDAGSVSTDVFDKVEEATGIPAVELYAEWRSKRQAVRKQAGERLRA